MSLVNYSLFFFSSFYFVLPVHSSLLAAWLLQLVICPLPSLTLSSVTIGCHSALTSVTTYTSPCPLFFPLRQQTPSSCAQSICISLWAKTVIDSWHLFPDVPSLPTQLPARINPLCRGKAKYREGADGRASPGVWRGIQLHALHHCDKSFLFSPPPPSLFLSLTLSLLQPAVLSQVSAMGTLSPRRSLYRTLSDESVCSNRKGSSYASSHSSMLDQAMPNDILFSTTPPYHSTLPPRMIHNQGASNLRSEYKQSNSHLAILVQKKPIKTPKMCTILHHRVALKKKNKFLLKCLIETEG